MSDLKLGNIIEDQQNRVAPVSSNETLYPGQHVGLLDGSVTEVGTLTKCIGIVDPFLSHKVTPGQKFWLFLYPQTVTSLRHEWTHPAFTQVSIPNLEAVSKAWLSNIAQQCGVSYERMIEAVDKDDYIPMGQNERYKTVIDGVLDEFQKHCEVVLGRKLGTRPYPFSCSC